MKDHAKPSAQLIHGDARNMSRINDNSVHLIVTSPPYWHIKDYQTVHQIGYKQSYEEYINSLNLVWAESWRVLLPGCRLCINIGDQYTRTTEYGRYKVIPIRTEVIRFCESLGFDYMGSIIWQKVSNTQTTGGASVMGSYPYPRNGILKLDYEFILIFKKPGKAPQVRPEQKKRSALTKQEWNTYFSGHWNFSGARQKEHGAVFPAELPDRLIKMFSFVEDYVLDPFLGSGTTMQSAIRLHRHAIGYEINREYISLVKHNMSYPVQTYKDRIGQFDYRTALSKLPYIFSANNHIHVIPAKHNPLQSHIQYHLVSKIVSPVKLELKDGQQIALLGIKVPEKYSDGAIKYLNKSVLGKQISIKHDPKNPGQKVYVYLKNKTFINAHLIKKGFAMADDSTQFHHKKRFIDYERRKA